jgi:hypothetical protein
VTTTIADLAAQLHAEQAHTRHLREQRDDLCRHLAVATSTADDLHTRVAGWISDGGVADHHALGDLAAEIGDLLELLQRARHIGAQA